MRLLVNENLPGSVVERLRQNGHDVLAMKESMRGAKDNEIELDKVNDEWRPIVSPDLQ